ncbi:tetratricopeptide repeat protein [Kaarinaea lacus]
MTSPMGVSAQELPIDPQRSDAILQKSQVIEQQIQQRKRQVQFEGVKASQEYESGFSDGYNKAIVDLVKSKLLNDPSLINLPKIIPPPQHRVGEVEAKPDIAVVVSPAPAAVVGATTGAVAASAAVDSTLESQPVEVSVLPELTSAPAQQEPLPQVSINDWLEKANSMLIEKNWNEAIIAASEAIALNPQAADSYIYRSWAYAEQGKMQQSIEDADKAIKLNPNSGLAYNNRAYAYELGDNLLAAKQDYNKACELDYQVACTTVAKIAEIEKKQQQASLAKLTSLSYDRFQQKDWYAVIDVTTQILQLDPSNTIAYVNRAGAHTELGEYEKALDDCNNALIIDPQMGIAYNNKGYVFELMGQLRQAALEYETACTLGVTPSCNDFKRLANRKSLNPQ